MNAHHYRNHLSPGIDKPLRIERTVKLPGHRELGNASRPAWTHGDPIETLPFVHHDDAPGIDTVGSALRRSSWGDWAACLCVAAAVLLLAFVL